MASLTCYHPIPAFQGGPGQPLKLWPPIAATTLRIPCGTCIGCRTDHASSWAARCLHESKYHEHSRFLTLTYTDEHLPANSWLDIRHTQLWLKRLRKARPANKLRYFLTGQYGDRTKRPHYHALLFGLKHDDERTAGKDLYQSDEADHIWGLGAVRIGTITGASATYVAQYTLRTTKAGIPADADGIPAPAQFATMSRRPGLGTQWLENFSTDLQHNYLVRDNRKQPVPRAYLKAIQASAIKNARQLLADIEWERGQQRKKPPPTEKQLEAAEEIHYARRHLTLRRAL